MISAAGTSRNDAQQKHLLSVLYIRSNQRSAVPPEEGLRSRGHNSRGGRNRKSVEAKNSKCVHYTENGNS